MNVFIHANVNKIKICLKDLFTGLASQFQVKYILIFCPQKCKGYANRKTKKRSKFITHIIFSLS
ncbi:hypothetical protein EFY79_18965 [Hanamia caeni]|uniref:Uncharacterized protein n=1 Tax=Hanamia caeni TaxID=2294116 RepID=A0A3M9N8J0_9BACT|nr:hypothetical protein EFY79_18965 [Hanamia caeni]